MTAKSSKESIYTIQFVLLCTSSFLFFSSFNMVIPELPAYLSSLGGEDYKGLIIALFTLTAGFSRPFSGKLVDKIGRIPVMIIGATVGAVSSFIYPLLTGFWGFLALRFFHGFSAGFKPTGTSTYLSDIVPAHRRGEAMGMLGLSGSLGMAMGPALGSMIANHFPLNYLFYTSSLLSILSIAILFRMKETLNEKSKFTIGMLKIKKDEVIEWRVMPPSISMIFSVFAFGTVLTIIPDFSEFLGIRNKGLFFTTFTLSSLAIRFLAGKASDRFGRTSVLKIGTALMALAMLAVGLARNPLELILSGVLFGVAHGMNAPTLMAWTVDLSVESLKGKALATIYIALEIGIGLGALISAWVYNNDSNNFTFTFWLAGLMAAFGFLYLVFFEKKMRKVD